MNRLLLPLRWVALATALLLNLWGPAPAGFAHEPETAIFAVAAYNAAVSLVRWRWLTPPRFLAADTLVFTAGIVATGGWHSSLFILYYLVVLAAALQLRPGVALGYTSSVGLLYLVTSTVLPNWEWELASLEVLIVRVASLLFVGLLSGRLARQMRAEEQLREAEQAVISRLTVLNELMTLELGSKLDLGKTLDAIARLARRAIGAEFSAVCLFPSQEHPGSSLAFDGVPAPQQGSLFREAQLDPIGQVVARTGQPLLVADISHGSGEARAASTFDRCRTLVCVPIKLEEAVIGLLYCGARSPDQIDQRDVDLLMAMGHHTALAIANVRMYDRERGNVRRLQEMEEMKSGFLSVVSHQLRTPITSIATAADLLMASDGNLSEDQRKLVQNVARNSLRLSNLVTDILQMARLKNGHAQLHRQAISPLHLVNEAVAAVKLLFDARGQTIEVRIDPALPKVEADRRKVEHVLVNLLSNACKFTHRGGIIAVEARELDGRVELAVRDDGPGMDAEARSRAFEPFYSANGPEGQGGTGLGLAIARGLVELHGGQISLESAPGAGTTVRFTLAVSH